jgi:AcrR family transcriptional regulator
MQTRLPVAQRRAQLVEAALGIAASEGIAAITIRRVADAAGVALGVVHYCFADKDELVGALAARIVEELRRAGAAGIDIAAEPASPPDVATALRFAVESLWRTVEASPGAQLLTYEITTHALRNPGLDPIAREQYEVSQAAAAEVLSLAVAAAGARWVRPLDDLAAEALAFVDGVTLRWLVDRDSVAARRRLDSFTGYLATATEPVAAGEATASR